MGYGAETVGEGGEGDGGLVEFEPGGGFVASAGGEGAAVGDEAGEGLVGRVSITLGP